MEAHPHSGECVTGEDEDTYRVQKVEARTAQEDYRHGHVDLFAGMSGPVATIKAR